MKYRNADSGKTLRTFKWLLTAIIGILSVVLGLYYFLQSSITTIVNDKLDMITASQDDRVQEIARRIDEKADQSTFDERTSNLCKIIDELKATNIVTNKRLSDIEWYLIRIEKAVKSEQPKQYP